MRPYATTAPATAAALAAQMASDWKAGNPSPRFRTLYLVHGQPISITPSPILIRTDWPSAEHAQRSEASKP